MHDIVMRRSPLFFVGDKAKILPQLLSYFPNEIDCYSEPFLGGGSAALNIRARQYFLSDLSSPLVGVHRELRRLALEGDIIKSVCDRIEKWGLTCSYSGNTVHASLIREFPKTYYAKANRTKYLQLRDDFNESEQRDPLDLYILIIYGFNRMLRFGKNGNFNVPVGNVDFNSNTAKALTDFSNFHRNALNVNLASGDFDQCLAVTRPRGNHFFYFDPPYLITQAEYNRFWTEEEDVRLMSTFDVLSSSGFKCALSNVLAYQGKKNKRLAKWAQQYRIEEISNNFIGRFNNHKKSMREVLILNY